METEINELFQKWKDASATYYNDEPIMSDAEFDELTEYLKENGTPEMIEVIIKGIQEVTGDIRVQHSTHEMISLYKIKYKTKADITDIKKFFNQPEFFNGDNKLWISPKLDGCSIKIQLDLKNKNNPNIKILTRGGMDVTRKLFENNSINDLINIVQKNFEFDYYDICGELVINKNIFNQKYSISNGGDYENPRNFVGAMLKLGEISEEILQDLIFIPCTDGVNRWTLTTSVWKPFGFDMLYNLENIISYYKSDAYPYLCDGLVIAFDESNSNEAIKLRPKRRVKDNYPLNMVAVKFKAPRARTTVNDMIWTQKKTGNLTPVLQLDPVKLEGSTVSQANGYNYASLKENGIGIGSVVEIEKSGDIIPVVVKVLKKSHEIKFPDVEYSVSGRHLKAVDKFESKKFKFIAGIGILNIDGIGPTIAENIGVCLEIDWNIINIFNKKYKSIICGAIGGASGSDSMIWQKFAREVYNITTLHLDTVIQLLQFDGVGTKMSKRIAMIISGINRDTKGMSESAINCCRGEKFQKIKNTIAELREYGIQVIKPVIESEETVSFEMTGEPEGMSKAQFVKAMQNKFGANSVQHSPLTRKSDYLITNDLTSNTGKMNKARKYNVQIITYTEALAKGLTKPEKE